MANQIHRWVAFIIVIALFVTPILDIEVLAQEQGIHNFDKANKLRLIGLFRENNHDFNLDKEVTRVEAAVMIVRLFGKEKLAKEEKFKHDFQDVPEWASDYVGYLYAKGIIKSVKDKAFGVNDKITLSQYIVFVLRGLGYDDSEGDFEIIKAVDKAIEIGLLNEDEKNRIIKRKRFIRDDIVGISVNALKTELKGIDKPLINKLIEDGAVSKQIVKAVGLYSNDIIDGVVELVFDDVNVYPWMYIYYENKNGYIGYEKANDAQPEIEIDSAKTYMKFKNFDWEKCDNYDVFFKAGNKLYRSSINKEDKGTSTEVGNKEEHGTVQISMPFAKRGYKIEEIEVHLVPNSVDLHKSITVARFNNTNTIELPLGVYNIHINAYDDENVYSLFKTNCIVAPGKNLIEFSRDEIAKIKVDIDYKDYNNIGLSMVSSSCKEGFSSISSLLYSNFDKIVNFKNIYITKINKDISISLKSEDGWSYWIDKDLENIEDCSIDFDLDFRGELYLDQEFYSPGENLVCKYHILDSYGNDLYRIYNPDSDLVGANVEFIDQKEKRTVHIDNISYSKIKLPMEPGEYTMKIKIDEGPIKIKPVTKKIKIKKIN